MFIELEPREYHLALPLTCQMDYCLAARSVALGMSSGTIHVDRLSDPQTVLVRTGHRWHLIGGDPLDERARSDVGYLLREIIWPQAQQEGGEALVLYYTPAAWRGCLPHLLPAGNPISAERRYLELDTSTESAALWLPNGFCLRSVTREAVEDAHLQGRDDLLEEMQSERASPDEFLQKSFGILAVHGNQLAGWCLSEYNVSDRCEVGIATMRRFRRQGIATAMATAFVAQARAFGFTRIGWHASAENTASLATAARLGFREVKSFEVLVAYFDPTLDLAAKGDACFRMGDYAQAAEWHERALAMGDAPLWAYWNGACAWAHSGDLDRSLALLSQAVDRGFREVDLARDSEHLKPLHEKEGWRAFLARLAGAAADDRPGSH